MNKSILSSAVIIIAVTAVAMNGCERKPYVEHKLKLENTNKDCNERQAMFRMVSNFGGERFEFEKCLPPSFSNEGLSTERRGDTVVVHFAKSGSQPGNKVYQVVLDIDSYPRYHFITIDEDTYPIGQAQN